MINTKITIAIFKKHLLIFSKIVINHPERVFIVIALLFGVLFVFRLPPLIGTDEFTHFPRTYQITQGIYWQQKLPDSQYGGDIPSNIKQMIDDNVIYRENPISKISINKPRYYSTTTAS